MTLTLSVLVVGRYVNVPVQLQDVSQLVKVRRKTSSMFRRQAVSALNAEKDHLGSAVSTDLIRFVSVLKRVERRHREQRGEFHSLERHH